MVIHKTFAFRIEPSRKENKHYLLHEHVNTLIKIKLTKPRYLISRRPKGGVAPLACVGIQLYYFNEETTNLANSVLTFC